MNTIVKHPAASRGATDAGWLKSRHTFSFGEYYDPAHMGFRALRVINDDRVAPGMGFGTHGHSDMEIFSYVVEGALEHKDSMGNGSVVKAGSLQYMSAGTGVRHSEYNPSSTEPVHFLQVWLMPNHKGGAPRYAEFDVAAVAKPNALTPMLSGDETENLVHMRQDARVYFGKLDAGKTLDVSLAADRHGWIHVIAGTLEILGETFEEGDGVEISNVAGNPAFEIEADADAEFLFFDLA